MIYVPLIERDENSRKEVYHLIEIENSSKNYKMQIVETGYNENCLISKIKKNGLWRILLKEENEVRRTYSKDLIREKLNIPENKKLKFTDWLFYTHFKHKLKI